MSTASRVGSAMYVVVIRYPWVVLRAVTVHAIPLGDAALVYVMSRVCRSVKLVPSVTTYWRVCTLVASTFGQ